MYEHGWPKLKQIGNHLEEEMDLGCLNNLIRVTECDRLEGAGNQ